MNAPADIPITQREWDKTPLSAQALAVSLWQENQSLKDRLARLQVEMSNLEERINKNSQNSSKPPSSDLFSKSKYPKKEASGQKKGGQPGYAGKSRNLKPLEQISKVVVCKPRVCPECGALLMGEDHNPERHQVSELPRIAPEIAEYQKHTLTCQDLEKAVDNALEYVQQQSAKNMDGTGWHELTKLCWLWVCATPWVADGAKQMLGENFVGTLGSDRATAHTTGSILTNDKPVGRISHVTFRLWWSAAENTRASASGTSQTVLWPLAARKR